MAEKPPSSLKGVQPYLMVAKQFIQRDPVVAYYANMYAVQEGIKLGKSDPSAKAYLITMMDQLQELKQILKDDEAMGNDVVAQAHIEEVALRLFDFADKEDRSARFHKNMIKAFFTSSQLFTIIRGQFGELSEEVESKMKYAKWKAVEIDRCLKSGITPTPGPPGGEEGEEFGFFDGFGENPQAPPPGFNVYPPEGEPHIPPGAQQVLPPAPKPMPRPRQNLPQDPQPPPQAVYHPPPPSQGGHVPPPQPVYPQPPSSYQVPAQVGPIDIARAQKLCKFASSALDYDDVAGAVEYLGKAMKLLTTGKED